MPKPLLNTDWSTHAGYPIQVFECRYGYQGGWIAIIGYGDMQDHPSQNGDVEAFEFWESDPRAVRCGRGADPNSAVRDLERRWRAAGCPRVYQWNSTDHDTAIETTESAQNRPALETGESDPEGDHV